MGGRHHVEPHGAAVPEIGRHHALAHVEARATARPAVHEEPGPLRHLDEDRVALAHIEEGDAEAAVARREPGPGRRHQTRHEEDAGGAARPPPVHADGQRGGEHPHRHGRGAGGRNMHERVGNRRRQPHREPEQHHERPGEVERERAGEITDRGGGEAEEPHRGGRTRERDHEKVRGQADQRELIEVGGHDRQHGGLRHRAHGEGGGGARRPAEPRERRSRRRREKHDAGRRREGELEARVPEIARPPGEKGERGQAERVRQLGLALEQDPAQEDEPHDGRAQHRRLPPHDEGEAHQGRRGDPGRHAARDADHAERREDRGRDERHVEAGDGQHVIDPGAPEGVVHLARERAALAEEQAGEERGRALGQRGVEPRHRPALHPRGPGRQVGGERPHAVRAPAAHERDTLPPELGGIVEAARVPIAHGRMEAQVGRDALALAQRGRFTIDRDERAPGGRPPLRLGHERLDFE